MFSFQICRVVPVLAACLFVEASAFGAAEFTLGQVAGQRDSTVALPLNFVSDTPVVAAEFDLLFDASKLAAGAASTPALFGQVVDSSSPTAGVRRVVIYSLLNSPFNSGLLLSLPVTILSSAPEGNVTLRLTNVLAASAQANPVQPLTLHDGSVTISSAGPARFVSVLREGTLIRLRVAGTEARSYIIQRSSDLRNWTPITTNSVTAGSIEFSEPASSSGQRFYRALLAP